MVSTAAACTTAAPPPTPAAPILEQPATTGVFANLYRPPAPDTARDAAVLVLGGSEGGFQIPNITARDLAAHGHPAMALAYFGYQGPPTALRDIPLEYFATALRLLATQPGVDPGKLVVWGTSRGSEAALLTAATYPDLVDAVIADSPRTKAGGLRSPSVTGRRS